MQLPLIAKPYCKTQRERYETQYAGSGSGARFSPTTGCPTNQ